LDSIESQRGTSVEASPETLLGHVRVASIELTNLRKTSAILKGSKNGLVEKEEEGNQSWKRSPRSGRVAGLPLTIFFYKAEVPPLWIKRMCDVLRIDGMARTNGGGSCKTSTGTASMSWGGRFNLLQLN